MLWESITSRVTMVVDDYETGEVLFEGLVKPPEYPFNDPVEADYVRLLYGFETSVEWVLRSGEPVALVTVDFGDKLAAFKHMLVAAREFEELFSDEPEHPTAEWWEDYRLRLDRLKKAEQEWEEIEWEEIN